MKYIYNFDLVVNCVIICEICELNWKYDKGMWKFGIKLKVIVFVYLESYYVFIFIEIGKIF